MSAEGYILATVLITALYLWRLLSQERYRLVLPSVTTCLTWLVASLLLYCQLNGWVGILSPYNIEKVAPFIFGMNLSSIICFSLVHSFTPSHLPSDLIKDGDTLQMCNQFLIQFRWILWVCVGVGVVLVVFFLSLGINFNSFADYRIMALTVKKVGYAALAVRIGGHIGILGAFYLIILGYKQSQTQLDVREFLKCILMYASVNLAIGGRAWLIASILPYLTGYMLGHSITETPYSVKNFKRLGIVLIVGISLFSILGNLRSEKSEEKGFFEKFLYYTDGPRMSNIVMSYFPEGTYQLEYGQANFLTFIKTSDMTNRFNKAIEHDIGLSVTVRSTIPALYYDFGYTGGMIIWGVLCGILELICLKIKNRGTLFSILIFCVLAYLPFQSPIGSVFVLAMPSFEWLFVIWVCKKYIFSKYRPDLIPYKLN